MEFVNAIPSLLTAIGGLIVALAVTGVLKKIGAFIDRIQM